MRTGRQGQILDALRPGRRIFLSGSSTEHLGLIDLFRSAPERLAGVELWSCLVPGVNDFDYGALHPEVRFVTFMASSALASSIKTGRTTVLRQSYSQMAQTLSETQFDLALLHLAPPDSDNRLSFGISSDTGPIVRPRSAKTFALVNSRMPAPPRAPYVPVDDIDIAFEMDADLPANKPEKPLSLDLTTIGRRTAALVPDGAAVQTGIGQAPAAVLSALTAHSELRIHCGLITPEHRMLDEAGALEDRSHHLAGIAFGDADFYRWVADTDFCRFGDAFETHGHASVAATDGFVSINSALEIDLSGALNIEWLGDQRISSLGGAPDYMASAAASEGGRSIVALPAASRGASRIVARLPPERVSLDGRLTDWIVTQHGAVQVKGLKDEARARAIISIADPAHRDKLERDWRNLAWR